MDTEVGKTYLTSRKNQVKIIYKADDITVGIMTNIDNHPFLVDNCNGLIAGGGEKLVEEFIGFKNCCFGDFVKVRDYSSQDWHPRIFEKVINNKALAFFRLDISPNTIPWNQCEKITHEEWIQLLQKRLSN